MHTIKITAPTGFKASIPAVGGVSHALHQVLTPLMQAQRRWRDGQRLACMDARMLRDIGISPDAARREANRLMGPLGRW